MDGRRLGFWGHLWSAVAVALLAPLAVLSGTAKLLLWVCGLIIVLTWGVPLILGGLVPLIALAVLAAIAQGYEPCKHGLAVHWNRLRTGLREPSPSMELVGPVRALPRPAPVPSPPPPPRRPQSPREAVSPLAGGALEAQRNRPPGGLGTPVARPVRTNPRSEIHIELQGPATATTTTAAKCPYCLSAFSDGASVVECSTCRTAYHLECWRENRGCAVYGCSGTSSRPAGHSQTSALRDVWEPRRGRQTVAPPRHADTQVYVTRRGWCFHRRTCWTIAHSRTSALSPAEARSRRYHRCPYCRPPG